MKSKRTQPPSAYELDTYVRQRARQLNINLTQLAEKVGITRQGLYDLLKNNGEKSELGTLIKLSNAISVHPFVLLRLIFDNSIHPNFTTSSAIHHCDATGFIADVTIPDGSIVFANATFTKTWKIQNIGSVDWIGRTLVCMDEKIEYISRSPEFASPIARRGLTPSQNAIPIPKTLPGQTVELSVEFIAPDYPGTQLSYWKMTDGKGRLCFPEIEGLSCVVKVITI